jgi:hypothetical protein
MQKRLMSELAGLMLILPLPARGEVQFSFATDRAVYTAPPSSRVPVRVYLQETTIADSSILLTESGLFSAGLKLRTVAPLPSTPTTLDGADDIIPDAAFSGGALMSLSPLTLLLADGILAEPGPTGELTNASTRQILLGTFVFTAASTPGAITHFQVTDFDDAGNSSDTLTWQGTELDKLISPGSFSIQVTPEPTALALIAAAGVLLRRRPRWYRVGYAARSARCLLA